MKNHVDWAGIERLGEKRVLDALGLALQGKSVQEVALKTGIPESSLASIRLHGPFAHRKSKKSATR
jgi:hypothetical protein